MVIGKKHILCKRSFEIKREGWERLQSQVFLHCLLNMQLNSFYLGVDCIMRAILRDHFLRVNFLLSLKL